MTPQPPNGHGGTCAVCGEPTVIKANQDQVAYALCIQHAQQWLKIPAGKENFKTWIEQQIEKLKEKPMPMQVTMTEDRKQILFIWTDPDFAVSLSIEQAKALVKTLEFYFAHARGA